MMSWYCVDCGVEITADNFWVHPHHAYSDVKSL